MANGDIRRFFGPPTSQKTSQPPASTDAPGIDTKPPTRGLRLPASSQPDPGASARSSQAAPSETGQNNQRASADGLHVANVASASFSSNATTSSTQRRVVNGQPIVLDSSDSDSDLEDVESLLLRFKAPKAENDVSMEDGDCIAVIPSQPPSQIKAVPNKSIEHVRRNHAKSKYSLDRLAASMAKERASERSLEAVLTSIGTSAARTNALDSPERKRAVAEQLDPAMLTIMMGESQGADGAERLLQAVERTEAARSAKTWLFFDDEPTAPSSLKPPKALLNLWQKPALVDLAYKNGTIVDAAACSELSYLSREILEWALRSTLRDPSDIQHSYCSLLLIAEDQGNWRFSLDWIKSMFALVGASAGNLNSSRSVLPISLDSGEESNEAGWAAVSRILAIIPRMAQLAKKPIRTNDLQATLSILCRLAIDPNLHLRRKLSFALQDAIEALFENTPPEEPVVENLAEELSGSVKDPQLRLHLLQGLTEASPRVALLRHQLALGFLLEGSQDDEPLDLLKRLINRLARASDFRIRPGMDFAWLAAMIGILDVAIGDGNPKDHPSDMSEEQATAFNKLVDALADRVKLMSSQIRDTGANHISKTEAKEALDSLYMRLLYAVRTRPRPKRNVFGESVGKAGIGAGSGLLKLLKKDTAKTADANLDSESSSRKEGYVGAGDEESEDEWFEMGEA